MEATSNDIEKIIRTRRVDMISKLFFDAEKMEISSGFRIENELWDYKEICPQLHNEDKNKWAEIAKDVLAFHNYKGGLLIFGVCDKSFHINRIKEDLDSKTFNDKIRKWIGDSIWVEFHREWISEDQSYIGVALIPPRGPRIINFVKDSPTKNGKHIFKKNMSAIREKDSSRVLKGDELKKISRSINENPIHEIYAIDEKSYRILAPDYKKFVNRKTICKEIIKGLNDSRSSVVSLVGIGGVGKTALATWAVINSYYEKQFDFIISVTAKDRELTRYGISAIEAKLTSFESLLDNIAEVMGFEEIKNYEITKKIKSINDILENSNTLLFIDNLETVDDQRIIDFLNHLPIGVRAIVTSRRQRIKFSAYPIDVFPLDDVESIEFINSIAKENGFSYILSLSKTEIINISKACDGIPLAIRWMLSSNNSVLELMKNTDELKKIGRKGEELLEFSFRRVFEKMTHAEKAIVKILSMFNSPIILETITIGTNLTIHDLSDAIELLIEDTIVYKYFSEDYNDSAYTVLPITRNFILNKIISTKEQTDIRKNLNDWFQGKDIKDPTERSIIQKIRQGREKPETSLLELANLAERDGDFKSAEDYYLQALSRNPKSYEASRRLAEFYRHKKEDINRALSFYEQAAQYAPSRGSKRALIYREWAILLKDSGERSALDKSIEKLLICLDETPNDEIASVTLASLYKRKGTFSKIPELLEKFIEHENLRTRELVYNLLIDAYEYNNDFIKVAEIKSKMI